MAEVDFAAARAPEGMRLYAIGDVHGCRDLLIRMHEAIDAEIALRGNHDDQMLNFLKASGEWRLFTDHGGDATASSYGVAADFATPRMIETSRAALNAAMPAAHRAFLDALPYQASFGDFMFCHAGVRPGVPLDRQDRHDLIWIRDAFLLDHGLHERVIVHGHTPVETVDIRRNRVNLDTRAFASGRLSAMSIEGGVKRIMEVSGSRR